MRGLGSRLTAWVRRHPVWAIVWVVAVVLGALDTANNLNSARLGLWPSTTTWWNEDGIDYIVFDPIDDGFISLPAHTAVQAKTTRNSYAVADASTCQAIGFAWPKVDEDQAVVITGREVQLPVPARTVDAPVTSSPRPVDPHCRVSSSSSIAPRTPSPAPSGG